MTDNATTVPVTAILLDARAAAKLCGVSRATWFSWQAAGLIPLPTLRRGRVVRWLRSEIEAWCKAGCPAHDRWQAMKGGGHEQP